VGQKKIDGKNFIKPWVGEKLGEKMKKAYLQNPQIGILLVCQAKSPRFLRRER
jgi:hypothetical protein